MPFSAPIAPTRIKPPRLRTASFLPKTWARSKCDMMLSRDASSERGTGNERPRPELLFVKHRFHPSSPLCPPKLVNCSATCCSIVSVSQRVDPILKAPHFHQHQIGFIGAVRPGSHSLKGGEEMYCKFM